MAAVVFFVLMMGIATYTWGRILWLQIRSASFPKTEATILESRVEEYRYSSGRSTQKGYRPALRYQYVANGKSHTGSQYRFDGQDIRSQLYSQSVVDSMPVGSKVQVSYDPTNPATSVLSSGLEVRDLVSVFQILAVNSLLAIFAWVFWTFPKAGSPLKVIENGNQILLRQKTSAPLITAVAGYVVLCTMGLGVVSACMGGDASLAAVLVIASLIVAGVVALYRNAAASPWGSNREVMVHLDDQTITVTPGEKGVDSTTIPASEIATLWVRPEKALLTKLGFIKVSTTRNVIRLLRPGEQNGEGLVTFNSDRSSAVHEMVKELQNCLQRVGVENVTVDIDVPPEEEPAGNS